MVCSSMKYGFDFTAANKYRSINLDLKQARFVLIDYAIAHPVPFSIEQAKCLVTKAMGAKHSNIVDELIANNLISLNNDGVIAYLYPVSCVETVHRVKLADGREFCAMCALDTLGCAATFGMPVEIHSVTKDTQESVHAQITPNGINTINPPDLLVSYYDSWAEGCINY